jgi:serine/threonine protein kinase
MESASTTEIAREQTLKAYWNAPESVRLHLLRSIASALDNAHVQGQLLHNLEPSSIVLEENAAASPGLVYLQEADPDSTSDPDLLQNSSPPERAFYFSPERILGLEITAASDQFSLAVLAHHLLIGNLPFTAATPSALFYQICTQAPHTSESKLTSVFLRALSKTPQDRFPTCVSFIDDLEFAAADTPHNIEEPSQHTLPPRTMAAVAGYAAGPSTTKSSYAPLSSNTAEISYLSERQRRRLALNDFPPPPANSKSRSSKWLILLALGIAAAGVLLFVNRFHQSPLPQQVLETHSAPTTQPPVDAVPSAKKASPTAPPQPESQRQSQLPTSRRTTSVQFDAEPAGANIVVDSDAAQSCQTPCSLQLTNGRHTLMAALNGYRTEQRIVNVPETLSINIPLDKRVGTLVLTSDPSGSEIQVDGRRYGTTPATLRLSPGPHQVSVENGGRRQQETIDITADSIQAKKFGWQ